MFSGSLLLGKQKPNSFIFWVPLHTHTVLPPSPMRLLNRVSTTEISLVPCNYHSIGYQYLSTYRIQDCIRNPSRLVERPEVVY